MKMKTGDVYNYTITNPKAKFVRKQTGTEYRFDARGKLVNKFGNPVEYAEANEDWELVPETVDFITAVKAFDDKKTIECRLLGLGENKVYKPSGIRMMAMLDQHGTAITSDEILNGKWIIE